MNGSNVSIVDKIKSRFLITMYHLNLRILKICYLSLSPAGGQHSQEVSRIPELTPLKEDPKPTIVKPDPQQIPTKVVESKKVNSRCCIDFIEVLALLMLN